MWEHSPESRRTGQWPQQRPEADPQGVGFHAGRRGVVNGRVEGERRKDRPRGAEAPRFRAVRTPPPTPSSAFCLFQSRSQLRARAGSKKQPYVKGVHVLKAQSIWVRPKAFYCYTGW